MRDLSRIRGEREIWITRGHLWALAITTCCIGLLAFFVGLVFGRSELMVEPAPANKGEAALVKPNVEADALEDLLARVEAASTSQTSAEVLTFPGSLPQGVTTPVPEAESKTPQEAAVPPGRLEPEPPPEELMVTEAPTDGWAVQVASFTAQAEAEERLVQLREKGVTPYMVTAVVDGVTRYRLRVGGFTSQELADRGADALEQKLMQDDLIVVRAP